MFPRHSFLALAACSLPLTFAAPAIENARLEPSRTKHERQLGLDGIVGPIVTSVLSGLRADATDGAAIVSAILEAAGNTIGNQIPPPPANVPDAVATLSSVFASAPTDLITNILDLIPAGFPVDELGNLIGASVDPRNSVVNANPPPPDTIFPKKDARDAPYSLTEEQLRQVIYIPSTFTFGQKPPVVLVPGTGNTGFQTFIGNYIPLLSNVDYADPVWLNIPGQLLGDAQIHAEYVAYAVNYISSVTGNRNNVNVLVWSQGSIDAQWAFKYWPSTRNVTQNLIANSGDYRGTVLANAICPQFPQLPCDPAVLQQRFGSNFITTLRANGGDSGIVPTTNIYSSTDEIVQPQSPLTGASGYLKDTCNVGVTNVLIQDTCGGRGVGGTFYTHEGVLYSSLGVALTMDALRNGRPARLADLDLDTVCAQYLGEGLDLINLLTTEEAILIAALSLLLYVPKVFNEPPIMAYATSSIVPICSASGVSSSLSSSMFSTMTSARTSLTRSASGVSITMSSATSASTTKSSTSLHTDTASASSASMASVRSTKTTMSDSRTTMTTSKTSHHASASATATSTGSDHDGHHPHHSGGATSVDGMHPTSSSGNEGPGYGVDGAWPTESSDDGHGHHQPTAAPDYPYASYGNGEYGVFSSALPSSQGWNHEHGAEPSDGHDGDYSTGGHCHKRKRAAAL